MAACYEWFRVPFGARNPAGLLCPAGRGFTGPRIREPGDTAQRRRATRVHRSIGTASPPGGAPQRRLRPAWRPLRDTQSPGAPARRATPRPDGVGTSPWTVRAVAHLPTRFETPYSWAIGPRELIPAPNAGLLRRRTVGLRQPQGTPCTPCGRTQDAQETQCHPDRSSGPQCATPGRRWERSARAVRLPVARARTGGEVLSARP